MKLKNYYICGIFNQELLITTELVTTQLTFGWVVNVSFFEETSSDGDSKVGTESMNDH